MNKILVLGFVFLFSLNAFSAVKTWDGGGLDSNWTTAANWVGDVAPGSGDDLVFPASAAQFTTNNNFFFLTNFNSVLLDGSYMISGNPFRLTNGLTVTSGTQTINTAITLNGPQTFSAGQGSVTTLAILSISGTLMIDGAGSFGIGVISGSGAVNKVGTGASLIASATAFSGAIFIGNGILVIDANIPNSGVIVEGPTAAFGGTGTVGAANVMNGSISAGTLTSPTGILNTGNLF